MIDTGTTTQTRSGSTHRPWSGDNPRAPLVAQQVEAIGPVLMPVFWLESLAIRAFGIAWLVNGDAIDALLALLKKAGGAGARA